MFCTAVCVFDCLGGLYLYIVLMTCGLVFGCILLVVLNVCFCACLIWLFELYVFLRMLFGLVFY